MPERIKKNEILSTSWQRVPSVRHHLFKTFPVAAVQKIAAVPVIHVRAPSLSQLAVVDCLHDSIRIDGLKAAAVADQQACIAQLPDQAGVPLAELRMASTALSSNTGCVHPAPFSFSAIYRRPSSLVKTVEVVVHDDPLAERLMDPEAQCVVEVRESHQEHDGRSLESISKLKRIFMSFRIPAEM